MKCRTKNSCEQQCSSLRRICPLVECHSKEKSCEQVSFTLPLQLKLKGGRPSYQKQNIHYPGGGGERVLLIMTYTVRLRPKGVFFQTSGI